MKISDNFKYKGLRNKLVKELKIKGIKDDNVLSAIKSVPRHFFVDDALLELCYLDKALPIGNKQTISQPYTVAFQSSLLDVKPNDKIMEIGTGSGYQAAILSFMKAQVYTIERNRFLFRKTKKILFNLGYGVLTFYGDGYNGLPKLAPFDKILITAAAPEIPVFLFSQLKIGGILVVPVGGSVNQEMLLIKKLSDKKMDITKHGVFSFVPMLKNKS